MPGLTFNGKEIVHNHHQAVPLRPLDPDAARGSGRVGLDGNPAAGLRHVSPTTASLMGADRA